MVRTLLLRGMLAGLAAGVLAFVVARLVGEGPLSAGIAFEEAGEHTHDGPELVSRTVQTTLGLATGTVVLGVALGGLFALGYAVAQGRLGTLGPRGTALLVAACGFLALHVLPALKYPANPPGSTDSDTIGFRTGWYFVLVLLSIVVVVGALVAARRLAPAVGGWDAGLLAVAGAVVVLAAAYLVLPTVNETPEGFPAGALWDFRMASSAVQLTLWATIGLVFGFVTDRAIRARSGEHPAAAQA
ncbi:CbtA family protein [Rhodococcus aerolatus]